MAQRLVLSVDQDSLTITQLRSFLKRAEQYGVTGTAKLRYTEDEGSHMLTVPIPNGVVPRRFVKRKKKERDIAEAAEKQVKARKEAIAKGEQVPGHVAPVKGVKKTAKKKRRAKKTVPAKKGASAS